MTAKRFTLAYETNDQNCIWWAVRDGYVTLWKEEVVALLNELYDENIDIKSKSKMVYERDAYKKLYNGLKEENEQLKQAYTQLKHKHSLLHDVCIDAECDRDSYRKDISLLEKENEQLKKEIHQVKDILKEYDDFESFVDSAIAIGFIGRIALAVGMELKE